jgi:hypothetical protein
VVDRAARRGVTDLTEAVTRVRARASMLASRRSMSRSPAGQKADLARITSHNSAADGSTCFGSCPLSS